MITEKELDEKYPEGTAYWEKDRNEYYICASHGRPTVYHRDPDLVVHTDTETECY